MPQLPSSLQWDDELPTSSSTQLPASIQWDDEKPQEERPWYDKVVPTALRAGLGVTGALGGGVIGAFEGGVGAIPGAMGGGSLGSTAGDYLAQQYEIARGLRKEYNPWETGVEGVVGAAGAFPFFKPLELAGPGIKEIAKYGARSAGRGMIEGGVISAAATPFQHLAREGELPSLGEGLREAGGGAVGGAVMGGLTGGALGTIHGASQARGLRAIADANQPPPPPPPGIELPLPPSAPLPSFLESRPEYRPPRPPFNPPPESEPFNLTFADDEGAHLPRDPGRLTLEPADNPGAHLPRDPGRMQFGEESEIDPNYVPPPPEIARLVDIGGALQIEFHGPATETQVYLMFPGENVITTPIQPKDGRSAFRVTFRGATRGKGRNVAASAAAMERLKGKLSSGIRPVIADDGIPLNRMTLGEESDLNPEVFPTGPPRMTFAEDEGANLPRDPGRMQLEPPPPESFLPDFLQPRPLPEGTRMGLADYAEDLPPTPPPPPPPRPPLVGRYGKVIPYANPPQTPTPAAPTPGTPPPAGSAGGVRGIFQDVLGDVIEREAWTTQEIEVAKVLGFVPGGVGRKGSIMVRKGSPAAAAIAAGQPLPPDTVSGMPAGSKAATGAVRPGEVSANTDRLVVPKRIVEGNRRYIDNRRKAGWEVTGEDSLNYIFTKIKRVPQAQKIEDPFANIPQTDEPEAPGLDVGPFHVGNIAEDARTRLREEREFFGKPRERDTAADETDRRFIQYLKDREANGEKLNAQQVSALIDAERHDLDMLPHELPYWGLDRLKAGLDDLEQRASLVHPHDISNDLFFRFKAFRSEVTKRFKKVVTHLTEKQLRDVLVKTREADIIHAINEESVRRNKILSEGSIEDLQEAYVQLHKAKSTDINDEWLFNIMEELDNRHKGIKTERTALAAFDPTWKPGRGKKPRPDSGYMEYDYGKRLAETWDEMHVTSSEEADTQRDTVFYDEGRRLTPDELSFVKNHPVIKEIQQVFDELFDDVLKLVGRRKDQDILTRTGIVLDPDAYGWHMPEVAADGNRMGGSAAVINFFAHIDENLNPKLAATKTVLTGFHETGHINEDVIPPEFNAGKFFKSLTEEQLKDPRLDAIIQAYRKQVLEAQLSEGHEIDFVYRLGEIYEKAGAGTAFKYADRLERIFTKGSESGDYSPEIQELLQLYKKAARRRRTTASVDPRAGIAESIEGRGTIPSDNQPDGEGTVGRGERIREGIRGFFNNPASTRRKPVPSTFEKIMGFPTQMTTTGDFSGVFRQALPMLFTPEFRPALKNMVKAFLDPAHAAQIDAEIRTLPTQTSRIDVQTGRDIPSDATQAGLKLIEGTDVSSSEHGLAAPWVEEGIPYMPGRKLYAATAGKYFKASNRAYATLLNSLRANAFERLMQDSKRMAMKAADTGSVRENWFNPFSRKIDLQEAENLNAFNNLPLAKQLADAVNTLTGRGPLRFHAIPVKGTEVNLESMSKFLSYTMFSPRLFASRMRMLNPNTYIMANPQVRQQYLRGALATGSAWLTMGMLMKFAGGEVGDDPTSADFGKGKFENFRLDPAGGFQQYLVAFSRLLSGGWTSSATGEYHKFGEGFRAETMKDMQERFFVNKLNPVFKFAYDLLNASTYVPLQGGDRLAQMFIPLILQDFVTLAKDDPEHMAGILPELLGMGGQSYEQGETESKLIPAENDIMYRGGGIRELMGQDEESQQESLFPNLWQ